MKRMVSLALAFCMALSLFTVSAFAATPAPKEVVVSPQSLMVDGEKKDVQKYNIDGSNYFKLRDLAYLLNGTGSQFGVGWDADAGVVSITTGEAYTPNGTELQTGTDESATAVASAQTIKIDGKTRDDLYVYNIGGANFFKLRDLGTALGFEVDFDAANNAATVTTTPVEQDGVSMMEVFGLSKNLRFVENPKTEAELAGNVLYCFAHGKYEINLKLSPDMPTSHWSSPNVKSVADSLPELAGMFSNQRLQFRCENNKLVFWYDGRSDLSAVEPAACYERQKEACAKAAEIHDQLHASGKITDGMTERQIAQVYYDYMVAKNVGPAHGPDGTVAEKAHDDSAYAALCTNAADCVGRAAAFNMLLHTEGIACCGVSGQLGGGHVLNYMVLDGTPYLGDWGNRMGMAPVKSFSNRFVPEKLSLEFAERVIKGDYSGLLLGAPMTVKLAGDKKLTVTVPSLEGAELDDIWFRFDSDRVGNTARGSALSLSGSTLTVDLSGFNLSDEQWESILNTGWFRLEIKSCYWHAPSLTK